MKHIMYYDIRLQGTVNDMNPYWYYATYLSTECGAMVIGMNR